VTFQFTAGYRSWIAGKIKRLQFFFREWLEWKTQALLVSARIAAGRRRKRKLEEFSRRVRDANTQGVTGIEWWTAWDSNPRPRRCERRALPTELAAHSKAYDCQYIMPAA
jgi:hypothetical protein